MPGVFWYGLTLRAMWPAFVGSVGVSLAGDLSKRTTYTVSVWCSQEALRAFVAHPDHLALIKSHQPRVESSAAVTWTAERLQLRELWALAYEKLAGIPSHG
jgi:hypothetical protein